jgi:hypothetical protein
MARNKQVICPRRKLKYFCRWGWTGKSKITKKPSQMTCGAIQPYRRTARGDLDRSRRHQASDGNFVSHSFPERSARFRAFVNPQQCVSRIQNNKPFVGVAKAVAVRQIEDKRPTLIAEQGFPCTSFLKRTAVDEGNDARSNKFQNREPSKSRTSGHETD